MARPTVVLISPSSGATGVPSNIEIKVTFDSEVDTYRLLNGGIILEGPESSKTIGAGFLGLDPPQTDEDDFLGSPGYDGIVPIDIELRRVDGSGNSVSYFDYGDTSGAGSIYRTQAVIRPKSPLKTLTQYTIYIVGDEDTSDAYDFGLSSRSVFDVIKGANLGTGTVDFYGGYLGTIRKRFYLEVTATGGVGTARFEWWTSTDPTHRTALTSSNYILLEEGVKVKFEVGKSYTDGDTFSVWCSPPEFMDGSYRSSFTTSTYEAAVFPAPSTQLGGSGSGSGSSSTGSFQVSSTLPENRSAMNPVSTLIITVTFNNNIDATTLTSTSVVVQALAADGSLDGSIPYAGTLTRTLTSSSATLTITLGAGQVLENNIVVITLGSTIADTDGNTLGSNYEFFFGSTYTPYYSTVRMVRLRLGRLGTSLPDETVALAIWDASREALAISPTTMVDAELFGRARREYVTCLAAWILTNQNGGSSDSVRKRLADFDVSVNSGSGSGKPDDLENCIAKWQAFIELGGVNSITPVMTVKGDTAVDSPNFGRLWDPNDRTLPMVNNRARDTGSRRWYHTYTRRYHIG